MSCTVWVWNYEGSKTAFGHASVSVYGGTPEGAYYISWWPKCTPDGSDPGKKAEYFGTCEPWRSRKLSQDIESEFGKSPDKQITLAGLDETAMKKFWDELLKTPAAKWSATTTNCAAAVAAALRAGGSDQYFSALDDLAFFAFHTNWWSWTPASVWDYARALQAKLRDAGKMP
jgi:hypothetical protein